MLHGDSRVRSMGGVIPGDQKFWRWCKPGDDRQPIWGRAPLGNCRPRAVRMVTLALRWDLPTLALEVVRLLTFRIWFTLVWMNGG